MNQLLLVRSSLVGNTDETEDTLARCVSVRKTCRILHARGGASLADHLTHDFDTANAPRLALALQAFVAAESRPSYFRSYHKLLQADDGDEILTTALWLKRAARARCSIRFHVYNGRGGLPYPTHDVRTRQAARPYLVALSVTGIRSGDDNQPDGL